ncbi:hypothetical protein AB5J72_30965 [Streptomyces sp. CG1]|uniref:hypothetical protein n=1 Tax=Streptomyces sp. CG1 TaxID=1287523 RepID=UPI0034E26FEC
MSPSTSALIVAVVGVVGTLLSGVLAHRSALRSTSMELDHAARQRHEDRSEEQRRETVNARKATYAAFNLHLRQFHQVLSRHYMALEAGQASPEQGQDREEPRRNLRDVYADAQMVVTDDVLLAGSRLVHQLHRIHALLMQHEQGTTTDESLGDIRERLERASQSLYEVRQTMRQDLGITELPVSRPDGYGAT